MESSFLGTKLLSSKGELTAESALAAPVLAIYFSAHWCPPCRSFTPVLANLYKKWNASNKEIEVIFVSRDRDEASFAEYFKEMPWLAIPFNEKTIIDQLRQKYKVSGIPMLVVVNNKGDVLEVRARDIVEDEEEGPLTKFKALYK
jgi:nucleoredoxin